MCTTTTTITIIICTLYIYIYYGYLYYFDATNDRWAFLRRIFPAICSETPPVHLLSMRVVCRIVKTWLYSRISMARIIFSSLPSNRCFLNRVWGGVIHITRKIHVTLNFFFYSPCRDSNYRAHSNYKVEAYCYIILLSLGEVRPATVMTCPFHTYTSRRRNSTMTDDGFWGVLVWYNNIYSDWPVGRWASATSANGTYYNQ